MTNKPDIKEQLVEIIQLDGMFLPEGESWKTWSASFPETTKHCLTIADQILILLDSQGYKSPEQLKAEGWVRKAENQELPENTYRARDAYWDLSGEHIAYSKAQQDMLKAHFIKIEE